ncbi:30S ribosomal protein S13 [Candidatus Gottesmanbacteria bacterium]|nr:30S ribosomal protein S13 [Candidatus Gottesmanbacteria bacterium]
MARIAGVDLANDKRIDIALTYIYGIGRKNVVPILEQVKIDSSKRARELTDEEIGRIQKVIDASYKVEGDLHQEIAENIKRLKMIGSYRGIRHTRNLPVRGQRTRVNARTKRGKRQTVGALRKDVRAKLDQTPAKPEAAPTAKTPSK